VEDQGIVEDHIPILRILAPILLRPTGIFDAALDVVLDVHMKASLKVFVLCVIVIIYKKKRRICASSLRLSY